MNHPNIDIAVVNYRSATDTLGALVHLAPWKYGTVWVVDNSCDDTERHRLTEAIASMPRLKLISTAENLGFGKACNLAFSQSQAPYFLLLNPDARIDQAAILALVARLQEDQGLAAVAPLMFWNEDRSFLIPHSMEQTPLACLRAALASRSCWFAHRVAESHLRNMHSQVACARPFDVNFLTGAVLMLRRSAISPGDYLFDPRYFMFYEDSDLCLRLRQRNWRLAVVPDSHAVHGYQHKAFKAALMTQARNQYFQWHFPVYYAASGQMKWVDRMTRSIRPEQWFETLPYPIESAADFARLTAGSGVIAFSPLLQMVPAIFRPADLPVSPFSDAEWNLLAAGRYAVKLEDPSARRAARWVVFERA